MCLPAGCLQRLRCLPGQTDGDVWSRKKPESQGYKQASQEETEDPERGPRAAAAGRKEHAKPRLQL